MGVVGMGLMEARTTWNMFREYWQLGCSASSELTEDRAVECVCFSGTVCWAAGIAEIDLCAEAACVALEPERQGRVLRIMSYKVEREPHITR